MMGLVIGFDVGVFVYIVLSFGFFFMVNVWVFFCILGGLFNFVVMFVMMFVKVVSLV